MKPTPQIRRYYPVHLNEKVVNKLLKNKKLGVKELKATKTALQDPSIFQVKTKLPYLSRSAWLRLEQGTRQVATVKTVDNPGGMKAVHLYRMAMYFCESKTSCKQASKKADQDTKKPIQQWSPHKWNKLPEGAKISSVLYGDVNRDGQTDVLLKLDSGKAILYRSYWRGTLKSPPPGLDFHSGL